MSFDTWATIAEDAIARASTPVAEVLRRLCAERGMIAVADAVALVQTARDTELAPPTAAQAKLRSNALSNLDDAVRRAISAVKDPAHDEPIRRWLRAGVPLIAAAARARTGNRKTFRTRAGLDRRTLERHFRVLGASKHEAEMIVSDLTPPPEGWVTTKGTATLRR